ncbi:alcohol oxidase [Dendrothele bispora CBS 962.96]|uniref:Alcohol oxidase n=1 Tax=Dendrothele bispora (strain CBS 962.96) TaxID=1314807 RepID=A0A4S8KYI2_DENBC|nr:alcohol oxidase [Dendrothele bispora CBS 962.96]
MKLLSQASLLGLPLVVNALAYDYIIILRGRNSVFVPGLIGAGQALTTLNWAYTTVPQTHLNGRVLTINAGKALGGSTVINSMIFPRAEKAQYDAWGTLNNDSSWTWNTLLPYFKKSEIFTPPNKFQQANGARFERDVHGFNEEQGRVKVGFPNFFFQQWSLWRQTAMRLGFPASPDLGNGSPHAVGVAPASSIDPDNNTRCSAACAYYTDFADRPNFTTEQGRESVITASDVEYINANNETQVVNVSHGGEVIVSAGTIGTHKVLELSGVGNSSILQAAGVKPILDLPSVGENFAGKAQLAQRSSVDVIVLSQIMLIAGITNDLLLLDPTFAEQQLNLWFENRTGFYSFVSRSLGIAAPSDIFNKSELNRLLQESEEKLNYFAALLSNGNPLLARGIQAQHRLALDLYRSNKNLPLEMSLRPSFFGNTSFEDRPARAYNTVVSALYAPLSRGRTHISSSDPFVPPMIDPAYWTHPLDVAFHAAGIKLARKMLTTGPMASIYEGEFEPGLDKVTDEDIENWLRGVVQSYTHEVGTMAMLPQGLCGVVDTKLRIYGLKNVRVAGM